MSTKLPVYELKISEDSSSPLQVAAIALVDAPAIERNWFAFKQQDNPMKFSSINEDEQIVVGPAMIPDMQIYRRDEDGKEYFVFFSKDTVKCIVQKFYSNALQSSANIMHQSNEPLEGVTYFLSWIKDTAKGMVGLEGDWPEGTWFVGAKIDNPDVWAKVKSGEIAGFSVEGNFVFTAPETTELTDEEALEKIKEILKGIEF